MSKEKVTALTVDSVEALESTVRRYVARGFTLVDRAERRATLQRPKKFHVALGVLGLLVFVYGILLYALVYAAQPDREVVDISME